MAIITNPTLRLVLQGSQISQVDQSFSWSLENKLEETYSLISTNSPITLNFSNIAKAKVLMLSGDGTTAFNVIITQTQTIGGNPTSVSFTIPNTGDIPTLFNITPAWLAGLTSIQISTASTTATQVSVSMYGAN